MSIMMPQALLDAGVTKVAIVRVDIPSATALAGFYQAVFADNGIEVVADLPVPAGTTDYSQFILAAQAAGAEGIAMPIGGQEGIQVLRAGQQLDADLLYSSSTGTFPLADILSLGEYGERVILNEGFPPAAVDDPVINQIVADLEANSDEELLQRPNLKASPMRSWIGLYALLQILRADGGTEFTREGVKALIDASGPIDMLGLIAGLDAGHRPRGCVHPRRHGLLLVLEDRCRRTRRSCSPARPTGTRSSAVRRSAGPAPDHALMRRGAALRGGPRVVRVGHAAVPTCSSTLGV